MNGGDTKDIEDFLSEYRQEYGEILKSLKAKFAYYSRIPGLSTAIYRIYSRSDKQHGEEFKAVWKIEEKLNRMRSLPEQNRTSKPPPTQISDVTDIIGITIACVYLSDIKAVCDVIEQEINAGTLVSRQPIDPETAVHYYEVETGGYSAKHYILGFPKAYGRYMQLWCEVQVKTVLHDAWSAKTHDLSYKPLRELDERVRRQFQHFGDVLSAIDKHSEDIKELILEQWREDDVYKRLAAQAMMVRLARDIRDCDPAYVEAAKNIVAKIDERAEYLSTVSVNDPVLSQLIQQIDALLGQPSYDSCRLFALVACLRRDDALLDGLLDRIHSWYLQAKDAYNKSKALCFRGLVLFYFGQAEEAIRITEQAVETHRKQPQGKYDASHMQGTYLNLINNLAYYYTEISNTAAGNKLNAPQRASDYVEELGRATHSEDPGFMDTRGAFLIQCGSTPTEVREGLELCRGALKMAEGSTKKVAEAFFALNERRWMRRLLRMENGQPPQEG